MKGRRFDLSRALTRGDPASTAAMIRVRRDVDAIVDGLFRFASAMGDPSHADTPELPARAAEILVHLGHEDAVLDVVLDAITAVSDAHVSAVGQAQEQAAAAELVLTTGLAAVGATLPADALPRILSELDRCVDGDSFDDRAGSFVELMCNMALRGIRDDVRGWAHLERLRRNDRILWVSFVIDFDVVRATAALAAALDAVDDPFASIDDAAFVAEAVDALEDVARLRARDVALRERAFAVLDKEFGLR
jgi:hypothetical protein